MDWRFCRRFGLAANSVGEHTPVLFALPILFVAISRGALIEILSASVSVAGDLGCKSRIEYQRNEAHFSAGRRAKHHSPDDSNVERWTLALVECAAMDLELGAQLASLVPGLHRVESRQKFGSVLIKPRVYCNVEGGLCLTN